VVLFYVTQPDRLLLWVVTSKGIRFIERPIAEHQLRFSVARIQRLLSTQTGAVSGATDRLLRDTLRSLHAELIAPARQAIGTATTLVIVPDGPLHALPFAALVDPSTDRHLVENYVIGIAPSLTTFRRANAGEKPTGPAQALLVGDPLLQAGPKGFASLPAARDEVRVLAGLYPGARTLIAADATRQAFFTHLAEADVVHYAGHAIVDDHEPDRSRLLLADDATATTGVLFVHELQTSTLPRRPLVVLAACSTNRGRIAAGEGVQSLARPFLEAGARSVIATLWDVDDRLSTALFRRFHQHVAAGVSSARALAEAQRELIAHPDGEMRAGANWAWGVAIGGSVQ
jgi:CHAT domain-containing protein